MLQLFCGAKEPKFPLSKAEPKNSQPWQWLTAINLPLSLSSPTQIPCTGRNSLRFPFAVRRTPLPLPRTMLRRRRGCRSSRRGRPRILRAGTTSTGWARRPTTWTLLSGLGPASSTIFLPEIFSAETVNSLFCAPIWFRAWKTLGIRLAHNPCRMR